MTPSGASRRISSNEEPVEAIDRDLRDLRASIGILKGKPFEPTDARASKAVQTATKIVLALRQLGRKPYCDDRQWERARAAGTADWAQESYLHANRRATFFQSAYSSAPAMVVGATGAGSKYLYDARCGW